MVRSMRLPQLGRRRGRGANGNGSPVYRQIALHIRSEIAAGELGPGDRLPPIRNLASDLGVNRDTVALAYESLVGEGWLESAVGRGTFVRRASPEGRGNGEAVALELAPQVEQLLSLENARPRFGAGEGTVSLHTLIPDPAYYPVDAFRRSFTRALAAGGAELLTYGVPQGHAGLRSTLAERFRRAGMDVSPDEIVLCHGASQGIALSVRLFAQGGDAVAVEQPTYHNVLTSLVGLGVRPVSVPSGPAGPDLAVLERVLSDPDVKAFYTIPSFHNPMGTSTSLPARRELIEVAARCQTPLIEDAFEMDLRFEGRSVPPLAGLDSRGLVVHLFSFSKSLFPGLRVGSVTARGRAVEGLLALKRASDLSDSLPMQAALEDFVRAGAYDRHLGLLRRMLRVRRDVMLEALESEMPEGTVWTRPEGGYQVWVELPFDIDTRDLLPDAARAGVLFAPGAQFNHDGRPSRCLRLTVAQADEDEIRRGVATLGRVVRERLDASPASRQSAGVHL